MIVLKSSRSVSRSGYVLKRKTASRSGSTSRAFPRGMIWPASRTRWVSRQLFHVGNLRSTTSTTLEGFSNRSKTSPGIGRRSIVTRYPIRRRRATRRSKSSFVRKPKSTSLLASLSPSKVSAVPPWATSSVSSESRAPMSRGSQICRSATLFSRNPLRGAAIESLHLLHDSLGERASDPPPGRELHSGIVPRQGLLQHDFRGTCRSKPLRNLIRAAYRGEEAHAVDASVLTGESRQVLNAQVPTRQKDRHGGKVPGVPTRGGPGQESLEPRKGTVRPVNRARVDSGSPLHDDLEPCGGQLCPREDVRSSEEWHSPERKAAPWPPNDRCVLSKLRERRDFETTELVESRGCQSVNDWRTSSAEPASLDPFD